MGSGVPMHFSTIDIKEIRKNLVNSRVFQEYLMIEGDDVIFFVSAQVFPMPGTVSSVWVFIGAEVPLSQENVIELSQEKMKKLLESPSDGEDSDDEETENPQKRKHKKGDWFN